MPDDRPLSIIVVGASGDLARKKLFPALFSLYCQGFLPKRFNIFGFARSDFSDGLFREKVEEHLTCRYVPGESCEDRMDEFLSHCFYVAGQYDSQDSFLDLFQRMREVNGGAGANQMFYLAIPPSVFSAAARAIGNAGMVVCDRGPLWSRVVIEKPFGKDRESSDLLTSELSRIFTEEQTYRIDHYLGKEVIQNLMVLRFTNLIFEPLWNRDYIDRVCIDWKEDIGLEGRAGYFDDYGIIRDVLQNHLLQILSLIAMEKPASTNAKDVTDEKLKILKSIHPLQMNNLHVGQYQAGELRGGRHVGYTEEASVPDDSRTPTYAAAVLRINNERWQGVPFVISAGKGLNEHVNEVRIHFKDLPDNIFCDSEACIPGNQLVIRIQPDETIYLKIVCKRPGLDFDMVESLLDLRYKSAFSSQIPDAYECLLLDVMHGDKSLFIRSDELQAAWDIFTPVLHEMDEKATTPVPYPFGTGELKIEY